MSAATSLRQPLDWRVAGVGLGLLSTLAVALQGPLGISGAYVTTEGVVARQLAPGAAQGNAYLAAAGRLTPEWFLVVGVVIGALVAAALTRTRMHEDAPATWRERFGSSRRAARFAVAAAGGFLLLFGARLAGGCTSGHIISGMSQLALSGMVFAAAVFASGIPVARAMYPLHTRHRSGRSTP